MVPFLLLPLTSFSLLVYFSVPLHSQASMVQGLLCWCHWFSFFYFVTFLVFEWASVSLQIGFAWRMLFLSFQSSPHDSQLYYFQLTKERLPRLWRCPLKGPPSWDCWPYFHSLVKANHQSHFRNLQLAWQNHLFCSEKRISLLLDFCPLPYPVTRLYHHHFRCFSSFCSYFEKSCWTWET